MKFVNTAFKDADVLLFITDISESPEKITNLVDRLNALKIPVVVVLNKIDKSNPEQLLPLLKIWQAAIPNGILFPVSALKSRNTHNLLKKIVELLPEHPPYFPKDALTDKSERFFVSEIIREKVLLNYRQEIPYSVEVEIDLFKEEGNLVRIHANIYVTRDSQKGIILGKQGLAIKKTATEARLDIEKFLDKKVYMEIQVKVNKDWRDNQKQLKNFGYNH